MAEGLKPSVANAILTALFHGTAYQGPANLYVQLHTSDPGANGTTGVANAGRRVALGTMTVSAGAGTNNADIVFTAVASTQTYAAVSLWDSVTVGGGNYILTGGIVGQATAGNDFTISAGQLSISISTAA